MIAQTIDTLLLRPLAFIGAATKRFLFDFGTFGLFNIEVFRQLYLHLNPLPAFSKQFLHITIRTLPTVLMAGLFVGAILVIQFNVMLSQYESQILLGGLNTSAVVREVGPLIISFLLAGKVGAYTAAELGTMRVTDQIDAMECLGTNSIQYLIVPRFFAIIAAGLTLLVIGLMVSLLGSMAVAELLYNMNPQEYLQSAPRFVSFWTLFCGLVKSLVYSSIVATIACYKGYYASGGAKGVGQSVTATALYTNFYIVIANFFLSQILESVEKIIL